MTRPAENTQQPKGLKQFADWAESWRAGDDARAAKIIDEVSTPPESQQVDDASSKMQSLVDASKEANTIHMHPVSIEIVTQAPIDTLSEMQSLYHISKNVIANLIMEWYDKGKIPHQLSTWMKEARTVLAEVHKMSAGFQDRVTLKKMDFAIAAIQSNAELRDDFKIQMIKELELAESMARKPKEVKL